MTEIKLRIDWADLDLFGHVNNVAFFKYMQAGRLNLCETIGLTSVNEKGKLSFMVANSNCVFKKPLYYPGEIKIITQVAWIKNSSFQLDHQIINPSGDTAAEGFDVLVVYDYENKLKTNIPANIRKSLENHLLAN